MAAHRDRPGQPRPGTKRAGARSAKSSHARGAERSVELRVERLAPGGAGLARLSDGRVVFIEATAPGDLVRVDAAQLTGRRGELGRALELLEAGPSRVEAPCGVAARCGGCDWMHLDRGFRGGQYLELLTQLLRRSLGAGVALPSPTLHRPNADLGYRSRARLHVAARNRRVELGFRASRSRELVEPDPCLVLEPELSKALPPLRQLLEGARGEGELQIAWGSGSGEPRLVLELRFAGDLPPELYGRLDAAVRARPGEARPIALAGARVWVDGAQQPLVYGDPRPVQRGYDGRPVVLAAGGFAQASDAGAALLCERVRQLAAGEGLRVVELFAGSGTLSIGLAADARELSTTEIDPAAVECARENLSLRGLEARVAVGDAEAKDLRGKPDVVVLDPPRSGAPRVCASLATIRPRRVVYVSCEPSTLARDLASLCSAGYGLVALEVLELFPQTSHFETVVVLERARPGRSASEV